MSSKLIACLVLLSLAVAVPANATTIMIDDFNGTTLDSNWVQSTVLDNAPGNSGTYTFSSPNNYLTATNSGYTSGARQEVLLRSDYSLGVGETLVTDLTDTANWTNSGSLNVSGGLVVAMSTGITERKDFLYLVWYDNSSQVYSYYFAHDGSYVKHWVDLTTDVVDELYINRTGANTYEVGYSKVNTADRIAHHTYTTDATYTPGDAIGYFADIRFDGNIMFDNFRKEVIPEPSTLALLAAGLLGLLAYAWKKRK